MIKKEIILTSKHHNRSFAVDLRYEPDGTPKPVVLFVHGFKGFKDAMHFNLMASEVAAAGYVFVKMNMSHNGVTPEQPLDFVDLEAFANNNFSIELDDVELVIDKITSEGLGVSAEEIDTSSLCLVGHSRGGSVAILKACEDTRVKKLVTWAAVPDLERFWTPDFLADWKAKGVQYIKNARTKQDMPMYYQMVDDFEAHADRFRIGSQLTKLAIPFLAIHGDEDETVPVESLLMLKSFYPAAETFRIAGAGHTFGGKHPWIDTQLPDHSVQLLSRMISFLKAS
ncbi:prolyl oligopeptidase family serine peptidase [Reichenbachiella carrageenanivorans]|uniref:Prolyl oligopeptidase family serine peptidase n=1 Tax=Reichenbachiella carrageenanivorans TaxID=2979869 RepID=A0ABY6D252_9BACT|nr:alpha/beta fold hydrolase [Reichenbachiella carrageenanivorans]UXX79173.1 prolyl oligopeptidase family serine peptidase [Reichenbachiella carrageenanivorans]